MVDSMATVEATRVLKWYFKLLDEESFEFDQFGEMFAADGVILGTYRMPIRGTITGREIRSSRRAVGEALSG
jgi:hypothetical protein